MQKLHNCSIRLYVAIAGLLLLGTTCNLYAEEAAIDASDPTKIYSWVGGGIKYVDYTNDTEMWEARLTGNLGITEKDMVLFEVGYGWNSREFNGEDDNDLTNGRLRWFHVFTMDYSVEKGYRGWASQVDVQIAGNLVGTDGQNVIAIGGLPAFGISENWSFYLGLSVVNSWDKNFDEYNGLGFSAAPLLVFTTDSLWSDAYLQLWPNYTRFISGDLSGEGSGNFDVTVGGSLTSKLFWALTYQKNFDKDLKSFSRGEDTGLENDQNVFFSITSYF